MIDLTEVLKAGSNTLAIAATNAGTEPNPAGLIGALRFLFFRGKAAGD